MQLSKQSKQRRKWYRIIFLWVSLLVAGIIFLYTSSYLNNRETAVLEQKGKIKQEKINDYSNITGLDQLLIIEQVQLTSNQLPWSLYIEKILDILEKIKAVDNDSAGNIFLSDFSVDLEKLSLNGFVGSLSTLYYNSNKTGGFISLLDRFEQLDFLKDIAIKTYEYREENKSRGFKFTLHANIQNDVRTK